MWEKRNKSEVSKKKTSAFKTETKNSVKCHGCGQLGHIKKNCRNPWPRNGRGGQRGAWQGGAPSQQQQQQTHRGGRGGGGRAGFRGYGRGRGERETAGSSTTTATSLRVNRVNRTTRGMRVVLTRVIM